MRKVRSKDTSAELAARSLIHGMGYRYRLHDKRLPGSPDLVFRSRRSAIFIHGCFWHKHKGCSKARTPKTNVAYWDEKFRANVERDRRNVRELRSQGWKVLVIWQCELKEPENVARLVEDFLEKGAEREIRQQKPSGA